MGSDQPGKRSEEERALVQENRLEYYNAPSYIKAYGLDSIIDLCSLPQYIEPNDDIENWWCKQFLQTT